MFVWNCPHKLQVEVGRYTGVEFKDRTSIMYVFTAWRMLFCICPMFTIFRNKLYDTIGQKYTGSSILHVSEDKFICHY